MIHSRHLRPRIWFVAGTALFLSQSCAQEALPTVQWKTECVGYYQLDLPGEVDVALVKPREFAPDMPNPKIVTQTSLLDRLIQDMRDTGLLPYPYLKWRIVISDWYNDVLSTDAILASGKTDTQGRMKLSQNEEKRLREAYLRTPWRLWLVSGTRINRLMCMNPPANENQPEFQEYCHPLKASNQLRYADGSQPRYAVRGDEAYHPRLDILAGKGRGTYQVTSADAPEVFEWLRRQSVGQASPSLPENTLVEVGDKRVSIHALRAGRIYQYYDYNHRNDADKEKSPPPTVLAAQFLKNFRVRAPFEVPDEAGVCLPYGFIADDAQAQRHMSVALRLKSHPEVEIFFMEKPGDMPNTGTASAEWAIRTFWRSLYETQETPGLGSLRAFWRSLYAPQATFDYFLPEVTNIPDHALDIKEIETIQIAGRNGKALFKKLFDHGKSPAYAYIAYAKGNPLAAREKPDLMFYLISSGESAMGTRLSKNELRTLAQRITASIKRRVPD